MSDHRKRSSRAHPQVVELLRQIRAGEVDAGVHEVHVTDREDLVRTVTAVDRSEADVSIVVNGLTAATLGQHAESICDLAVESRAPLLFWHHGQMLQLARVENWPPQT